jgi:hypothetical protein
MQHSQMRAGRALSAFRAASRTVSRSRVRNAEACQLLRSIEQRAAKSSALMSPLPIAATAVAALIAIRCAGLSRRKHAGEDHSFHDL